MRRIRAALASGTLIQPFRAADVNRACGITYAGTFLSQSIVLAIPEWTASRTQNVLFGSRPDSIQRSAIRYGPGFCFHIHGTSHEEIFLFLGTFLSACVRVCGGETSSKENALRRISRK